MFSVFLASIGYAGGVVIDKLILAVYRTPVKKFVSLLFIFLAVITFLFVPSLGAISSQAWEIKYLFLFILMIVVALVWNVLYYKGIQKENLHEFELIMLLSPLITIIFAEIFLPSERNANIFFIGLIASIAFIASRLRHHHLQISMVAKSTVLAMILLSFESVLIKGLLNVYSPVALYFLRTLAISIVFYFMYKPNFKSMALKETGFVLVSALFGVLQMVLKFYGFKSLGVIETTMMLLIGPFLVYGFSYFYFHERQFYKKDIICAIIVILCIIYSTVTT